MSWPFILLGLTPLLLLLHQPTRCRMLHGAHHEHTTRGDFWCNRCRVVRHDEEPTWLEREIERKRRRRHARGSGGRR